MFSLVLPFHSDIERLLATLDILKDKAEAWRIKEILLAHNGNLLPEILYAQIHEKQFPGVRYLHTDAKGIGAGYKLGIFEATEQFVVLSASDLPFGFSDIKAFLAYHDRNMVADRLFVGSKAHPQSEMSGYPLKRRIASRVFYLFRAALLGRKTPKDSQGTIIVEAQIARQLARESLADDYFFSLEFLTRAIRKQLGVIELPVCLDSRFSNEASSVHMLKDGWKLCKKLLSLRYSK